MLQKVNITVANIVSASYLFEYNGACNRTMMLLWEFWSLHPDVVLRFSTYFLMLQKSFFFILQAYILNIAGSVQ